MFEFAIYGNDLVEILALYTDEESRDWCTVGYTDGGPEFDVLESELKNFHLRA